MTEKLMRVRIPAGWAMVYNSFGDEDPISDSDGHIENYEYFKEDLFSLRQLTVTDEGPGLPPAERERVFAPFYRGARPMTSGTGLGLPLALHVAVSYGGALVLEPAPGGVGLRAVLTLPAWRPIT